MACNIFSFPALLRCLGSPMAFFLRNAAGHDGKTVPFNLGLACGTPEGDVWHNRQRALSLLGNHALGVFARQVHGGQVAIWDAGCNVRPEAVHRAVRLDGDALITAKASALLIIQVADCQPVVVIDPVQRVVANIHSGWRGSIQNIIGATIEKMVRVHGCCAAHLVCGIGPSLGPCCAEFVHFRDEIPEPFWRYRRHADHFDFWQISVDQLVAAGVPADNISVSGMCTRCNPHLFFSYRQERSTGRFASVVGIRPI